MAFHIRHESEIALRKVTNPRINQSALKGTVQ